MIPVWLCSSLVCNQFLERLLYFHLNATNSFTYLGNIELFFKFMTITTQKEKILYPFRHNEFYLNVRVDQGLHIPKMK